MAASRYFDNSQLAEGIRIANGQTKGVSHIHKFGFNADIDAAYEIIWEQGGALTYPTTAAVASINSASSNSGTEITVQGLDGNYDEVSDTITLDGSGDGSTTQTFLRINRAFISNNDELAADVTITVGANTLAKVSALHRQTLQCIYTVPDGKAAYLTQLNASVQEKDKQISMRFFVKENHQDSVFRTRDFVTFQTTTFQKTFPVPLRFGPQSDIQLQAISPDTNTEVSGNFDLILVDE